MPNGSDDDGKFNIVCIEIRLNLIRLVLGIQQENLSALQKKLLRCFAIQRQDHVIMMQIDPWEMYQWNKNIDASVHLFYIRQGDQLTVLLVSFWQDMNQALLIWTQFQKKKKRFEPSCGMLVIFWSIRLYFRGIK